jgi:tetraacyldisaccharide 4'-kinase
MRAPGFWETGGWLATALTPASWAWRLGGAVRRLTTAPYRPSVPLICVGNAVAGGAGKTPVVLALAAELLGRGLPVGLLSRGHGGRRAGPLLVDPGVHSAGDVGDEPLLLAGLAPTVIARDRSAGARLLEDQGVAAIVMDDGLQNPSVSPDLSLLVVDGGAGFGNAHVMPAGPLRESVGSALDKVAAVVLVGEDRSEVAATVAGRRPILAARLVPSAAAERLRGRTVFAFAGIGRPEKFRETLIDLGADVVGFESFPDHHPYRDMEVMELVDRAAALGAELVTTSKDSVRLPPEARPMATVVEVSLLWRDPAAVARLLDRLPRIS